MKHQPEYTDLFTFLINIGCKLEKEGAALQALADQLFEDKAVDENKILQTYGVDIAHLGRKLVPAIEQLCQPCKLKQLSETIIFSDNSSGSSQKES